MPYIDQASRQELWHGRLAQTPGELNFVIAEICNAYLDMKCAGANNYSEFNEVIGVLECQKLELYRRLVAPYEDKKLEQSGDVYSTA